VTSSLTAESPTIQKLQNILGVDIRILATQVMRARKTRKWLLMIEGSIPRFLNIVEQVEASIGFDDTKAVDGTSFTDSQCVLADDAALM
jgi:hypothetical protein